MANVHKKDCKITQRDGEIAGSQKKKCLQYELHRLQFCKNLLTV